MKRITTLIEAVTAADTIINSLRADGLKKDQIINILMQNDIKVLKQVSDNLKSIHKDNYFPYEPVKDDFINDRTKDKVCKQIADAIINLEKK